ncbi:MAG: PilN domain-containing protein, partial [Nitrospinota bacterium]|nr:PilN domain-containing protein [Nitrospinota bacterium]
NGQLGSKLQAIVDISSTRLDVSLIKGKTLIASRSVSIPDKDFKKVFFHHDLPESLEEQVTKDFSTFLTKTLESTLYGCKSLENEESITQINLFGGGRGAEALVSALQTQTSVKTEAVLPTFLKKDSPLSFTPSLQMTSLGLSLRPALKNPIELNLHSNFQKSKRKSSWKTTVVLLVMVLAVLTGLFLDQTYKNENTLASLNRQLEEIKPQATQLQKIDEQHAHLAGYTESLNAIERQSPLKLPLLQELSKKLPKDTWVTRISIKQNQVEVRGYSAATSRLIPLLEESDFLKNTQFKGSITTQALGERFTIQSTMEPRK